MKIKVLVAYATKYGSTHEVAEKIAAVARKQEMDVDILPAAHVDTLNGYQAVILGTGLYIGHMHKDAFKFLSKYEPALSNGKPLAIFAGGPLQPEDDCVEIRKMLNADLAKYPELKPIAVEVVGGRFDPEKLRFPWTMLPAMKNIPPSDLRDWCAINQWTINLVHQFKKILLRKQELV